MPLRRENGFLPDLDAIPADVARAREDPLAQLPEQPDRGARAARLLRGAGRVRAASTTSSSPATSPTPRSTSTRRPPPSFLRDAGRARTSAIEFHSLSKTYNMTGWRVGFACGNRELVAGLGKVKTNVDSGVFEAVQRAAIAALDGDQALRRASSARSTASAATSCAAAWRRPASTCSRPTASFYMLVANPQGLTSIEFASRLLTEARHRRHAGDRLRRRGRGLRPADGLRRQGAPRRGGPAPRRPEVLTPPR